MKIKSAFKKSVACGLSLLLLATLTAHAQSSGADDDSDAEKQQSFYFMDSTEAQWGRRSVNDSVYRNLPVNAVYLERGKRRLPDSFKMYKPATIDKDNMVSKKQSPTTIRVNGRVQKLATGEEEDK